MYDDFNEGEIDEVLAIMAEDIEWTEPEGSTYGGTYESPEAVLENVFEAVLDDYEEFHVECERVIDGDEMVVALGTFYATPEMGERIESPFAHVCELEDGRITRFADYTDTALWQ